MIGFLRGKPVRIGISEVILDVGGVGYVVNIPSGMADRLKKDGEEITLFTYMAVSESNVSLFGFLREDDLSVFKQLITVSGIGPKGAQSILSVLSPDDLRYAIISEDVKAISKAPGVGAKTAQRVILELKDKLGSIALDESPEDGAAFSSDSQDEHTARSDAVSALVALGYSPTDSYKAVKTAIDRGTREEAELLIKAALKVFVS